MDWTAALWETEFGKLLLTAAISMVPVVELRGGIPFGIVRGLQPWAAYFSAVLGNMLPVPFVIIYIRRVLLWLRHTFPQLRGLVDRVEKKAHLKSGTVRKYQFLGLFLFVSIPLPGTGGWTGALVAAFLNIRLRHALPSILAGLLTAGAIMLLLTNTAVEVLA